MQEAVQQSATPHDDERYNFSRAGHLGPDLMRGLGLMQEHIARSMTHTLSAWLRTGFNVTVLPAEQKNFGALLAQVPEVSYVCSVRMEPLGADGILQMDLQLAPPIVDVLLGGTGRQGEVRDLTEIEEAILFSVTDIIVRELNKAWQSSPLQFVLGKRERDAQLQRLMPYTEKLVQLQWTVTMPEATGVLSICLPTVAVSSAMRKMAAQRERPRRHSDAVSTHMRERVSEAQLPVTLRMPSVVVRTSDVVSLRVGQVFRLGMTRTETPFLAVGDTNCFTTEAVRAGENRGARIVAPIQPSAELEMNFEEEA